MKAIFERKLNFERKELVSRIQRMQARPDIQKILKNDLNDLPSRLIDYLKKLDLLNGYGQLTADGEKALKEGEIIGKEFGQFEIWYLKDDPWFETIPVALHRIKAGGNWQGDNHGKNSAWNPGKNSNWCVDDQDVSYPLMDSDAGNQIRIRSLSVEAIRSMRTEQEQGLLRCETEEISEPYIKCEISGNLRWSQRRNSSDKLDLERYYNGSAKNLLSEILGSEYDRVRNALIVKVVPTDTNELTSFVKRRFEKCDVVSDKHGTFSHIVVEDFPMRAANQSVAKEWLLRIMQHNWGSRYVSREQTDLEQKDWLQSQALRDMKLLPYSGENLLNVLGSGRGPAYWNVAAMQDLIPSGVKAKVSFTLSKDETNVDQKIKHQLFDGHEVRRVIISDGYVTPESLPVLEKILPKDIQVQIHSFKHKLEHVLPLDWIHKNLQKGDTHDRIWLINCRSGWEYWNFSTSTDHFYEKNEVICVNKQMTIAPIVKLPQYLQDIVDEQMSEGML